MLVPIFLVTRLIVLAEGPGFEPWVFVLIRTRTRSSVSVGRGSKTSKDAGIIFIRRLARVSIGLAWPSRGLDLASFLGMCRSFGLNRAPCSRGASLVCSRRPAPGSAMLIQLSGGPIVEGRIRRRLIAFWSLALPNHSRTRTTSTRTRKSDAPLSKGHSSNIEDGS
jgi:hypothetical protein